MREVPKTMSKDNWTLSPKKSWYSLINYYFVSIFTSCTGYVKTLFCEVIRTCKLSLAITEAPVVPAHNYVKEVHIPRRITSLSVIGAYFKNHSQHNTLQSYFSGVLDVRGRGWVLQRIVLETNIEWFGVGWGEGRTSEWVSCDVTLQQIILDELLESNIASIYIKAI